MPALSENWHTPKISTAVLIVHATTCAKQTLRTDRQTISTAGGKIALFASLFISRLPQLSHCQPSDRLKCIQQDVTSETRHFELMWFLTPFLWSVISNLWEADDDNILLWSQDLDCDCDHVIGRLKNYRRNLESVELHSSDWDHKIKQNASSVLGLPGLEV